MKKKTTGDNGSDRLEEALAQLIQNQATFVQNQATFLARLSESERVTAERFARIEADMATILRMLAEHSRILAEHSRILQALPEAIREKIGFKPQP